jgi:cobalt-zinc-cadmium efflux system outer membrane protein
MLFRDVFACAAFLAFMTLGCQSSRPRKVFLAQVQKRAPAHAAEVIATAHEGNNGIETVSYGQQPELIPGSGALILQGDDPFLGQSQIDTQQVVAEVLSRNPSLQAMIYAWRAAAARYPQVVSLEDPMFGFMIGPAALGHESGSNGYMLDVSQKIPWHGKRYWKGQSAIADTSAARADIEETRLRLIALTKAALADYYLVARLAELNVENSTIMRDFRDAARVKYETNQVTQEDVLQADVELADVQRRTLELERMRRVAMARINTLLHRAPDYPLPPPPNNVDISGDIPSVELLRQVAIERRPELAAEAARIRAERASLAAANLEYYPDLEIVGRYDGFWENSDLRPQVGMNVNMPIYQWKRDAAVREAANRLNQRCWQYQQRIDEINNDVQQAYEQAIESQRALDLYESKILPAARQNAETARTTYTTAKLDFLRLIESQRRYIMLQEKWRETEAEALRRLALLEQAIGGPIEIESESAMAELGPGSR